jgi:Zn-dependent M16 (insulinase) family peptidase
MGSKKYPYKGIIDHLANRGFSNGTNAWTDTDHTAYTVSTAGEQGFLQLLPIYVDHILYPTMTKAGFVTEVTQNTASRTIIRLTPALPRCTTLTQRVMILA